MPFFICPVEDGRRFDKMLMKIINIDRERFKQIAPDVYCLKDDGINKKTFLYKYVDLLALADIVKNGNFKVNLRRDFSDRREHGELKNPFVETLLPVGKDATPEDRKRWEEYKEMRWACGFLPTSCFTREADELYAMWAAYTTGYTGVHITMTVGDFIDSISKSDYEIFIGNVEYLKKDVGLPDLVRYIFAKNACYIPENELRMYFIPKGLALSDDKGITIKIDGMKAISEIVLSPFIPQSLKGCMIKTVREIINDKNIVIRHSEILEKSK